MKTCLLYSGQARTGRYNVDNHAWFLRTLPNPDVFVSVAKDEQADDMLLFKESFPNGRFEMETVIQPTLPEPVERSPFHSGYPRSATPQGVLRQLWSLNRGWEFFCEKAKPEDYDLFVRVRPDINFMRLEVPSFERTELEMTTTPGGAQFPQFVTHAAPKDTLCLTPWWSRWNGINDRFAIMGRDAARAYFTAFQKWPDMHQRKCPLHPETIMREALAMDGITPDDSLLAEFKTVRLPDAQHPKVWFIPLDASVIDVADLARKKAA